MGSTSTLSSFAARLRATIALPTDISMASDPASVGFPFNEMALELFARQFESNVVYRNWCAAAHVTPDRVRHWQEIPAISAVAFKECDLSAIPESDRVAVFESSGTTEQRRSRHHHSLESLALYEASALTWFRATCAPLVGEFERAKTDFLFLTPSPEQAPRSSLVHMFESFRLAARTTPGTSEKFVPSHYGLTTPAGAWSVDLEALVERINANSGIGRPVFVAGTAFNFVQVLDYLAERGMKLELPVGSVAFETGGYKGRSRVMERAELHAEISKRMGVAPGSIVTEYGMSELSSQAYRITGHSTGGGFRFPPWARAAIVSPENGRPVREGEIGLVRVCDLANVYSVAVIQTEDLGRKKGDAFELIGRAERAEARGCSLMSR